MMLKARAAAARPLAGARSLLTKASAMPAVPLTEAFPSTPATSPQPAAAPSISKSVTNSGLVVASDGAKGPIATIGVQLKAGSRYETDETAGVSALFSKMAFRATEARSDLRLYRDIEAIGGVVNTFAGREYVRYSISVLADKLAEAAEILAETTLAPKFAHWDIDTQKALVIAELENIQNNTSALLLENVHAAAFYDDATLGRPVFSTENLSNLDTEELFAFYNKFVNTGNAALVGTGVEQSTLVDIANAHFGSIATGAAVVPEAAQYVGGESRVKVASKFTHVALAFPTSSRSTPEYGATHVLRALLGLRLKSKKATSFMSSYEDASLVGFSGYAAPDQAGALVSSFVAEFKKAATTPATKDELGAAKALCSLQSLSGYNTRAGTLSRVGIVTLTSGFKSRSPTEHVKDVTAETVQALAKKAIEANPSLAAIGKLTAVPHINAVRHQLQ